MEKAIQLGKTSAKGSFHLFVGVTVSTMIMAVGTIILARLMTQSEYGLYSIALIPSSMMILFRDWGVNSAITRYTASLRAENKENHTKNIIYAGLTFEILTGTALSLLSLLLSSFIATTVFHRPELTFLIAIASTTILFSAILTAVQSTFIGFERMELNSLTIICQAIGKTIISSILVLIGYSALGAVLGYTISLMIAALTGIMLLYFYVFRKIRMEKTQRTKIKETLKKMLKYGVPLSISSILNGFLIQFYAFLMAIYCTDAMIGNYQVATQFAIILTFFTGPILTVLFPAFSKINPKNEEKLLQTVFAASIKYASIILIPVTMAVMVLSKPMVVTLFGEKWGYAPLFLTLYVVDNLFVIFGTLSLESFLSGIGETKMLMKLGLINMAIGIPMAFILIPSLGIIGLILTIILAKKPSMILGLYWVWKHYQVKADFNFSIRMLLSSSVAAAITYMLVNAVNMLAWVKLIVGGIVFFTICLTATPAIRAVSKTDVENLKIMLSGFGVISKLLNIPLVLAQKIARP